MELNLVVKNVKMHGRSNLILKSFLKILQVGSHVTGVQVMAKLNAYNLSFERDAAEARRPSTLR
jgi:hypothetical protein